MSKILCCVTLVYNIDIFSRTAVLRKSFDIGFSYKHCNFSSICLLIEMTSKETLTFPLNSTCLLWTPHQYGHFLWPPLMAPSVSEITGFDCTGFTTTATTTTTTIFIVPKAEYYSYLQVVKLIN